ncbi:MAG: hypothetical protein C0609_05670 [Deltaproteobacteria bacterium]|nr:MAG: hypothetical protein C0609_05670 [Deltaproteobacteria bacterium]
MATERHLHLKMRTGRKGKNRAILALTLLSLLLLAFVPLPADIFERCRKATPSGPVSFRAFLNGEPGHLHIVTPGHHKFIPDEGESITDPGPIAGDFATTQALWRILDFYSPIKADMYGDLLLEVGVDLNVRGWVRLDPEGKAMGETIGSKGETDPKAPHAIFDRETGRIVKVLLWGSQATSGPAASSGFPRWFNTSAGFLELVGEPTQIAMPAVTIEFEGEAPALNEDPPR